MECNLELILDSTTWKKSKSIPLWTEIKKNDFVRNNINILRKQLRNIQESEARKPKIFDSAVCKRGELKGLSKGTYMNRLWTFVSQESMIGIFDSNIQ